MRTLRWPVAASLVLLVLTLQSLWTTASGTPAIGTATTTPLNTGTIADRVQELNNDGVQFKTQRAVDVVQVTTTADPGWSSGWHKHTGPVLVTIKSGTLTVYTEACVAQTFGAGQAFVERTGEPIVGRNESSSPAVLYTTQIIPAGASRRIDVSPGLCGVS